MSQLSRIAGLVYPDPLQVENLVADMLDTMQPGLSETRLIKTYKNVQLGQIGAASIHDPTKKHYLLLDGTLNNLKELEANLRKGGIVSSPEPASLVLSAYELWGEEFLTKIDGQFALALFDKSKQTLLLARDRIGIKPLYWYQGPDTFIFASELKALLSTGLVPQTPSEDALAMYLYFGFIPQDLSPIHDVSKLLPGTYLTFSPSKGLKVRPYWSYSACFEKRCLEEREAIETKLSSILNEATKRLLPTPPQPLACFVSGGLGSATVAWELSRTADAAKTEAFSVGFEGEYLEDLSTANKISEQLGLEHEVGTIGPKELVEELVNIVWSLDEPLADPNIAATWKLAAMASKKASIVFSGMGSDEFLAGHSRYTKAEQDPEYLSRFSLIPLPVIRNFIIPLINKVTPSSALKLLKISKTDPWQFQFLRKNALFDETKMEEVSPRLAPHFDPDTFLHKFHSISRISSTVASLLYFDVKTRLPDHFIMQYERLTKAHGLSWRSPFLDRRLVEYTAELPEPAVLAENEAASYLKPLLSSVFPSTILNRPKRSRHSFLDDWVDAPEIKPLFELLRKGTLIETGLISKTWLENELDPATRQPSAFLHLWSILVLEVWFHLFINHPVRKRPRTSDLTELLNES